MESDIMAAKLIDDIATLGRTFLDSDDGAARTSLIAAAEALIVELYTPFELAGRLGFGEPSRTAAVRVAFELGLLKGLADEPRTSEQLAAGTIADPVLVVRTLKHLAANGLVREVGKDLYAGTRFSKAIDDPAISASLRFTSMVTMPTFLALPEFLAKNNYQTPADEDNSPLQFGLQTDKTFYEAIHSDPTLNEVFNNYMKAYYQSVSRWTEMYPVRERLGGEEPLSSGPLLVDVGGNVGYQLVEFHKRFPDLHGRLVLQDRASVIASAPASAWDALPAAVTVLAHDFFTPQPAACRGARAYYMRFILHDWPDAQCAVILSHLRDAMAGGSSGRSSRSYSRLLINDVVLPDTGASWRQTSLDWIMMAMFVSRERTESQWRALLAGAGLQMSGVWHKDGEGLIEAVLDSDAV
ncbi:O-methyltransferase [Purpureocillium lavendulum]|uniref:O-methyltransferase n=1 Tax=Purpureocillium lavendulum TaxID=1247861 RepID=A0AB34FJI4_9HYPO|nr:O-methyltransferase [Purpureocillium lavendulum]